MSYRDDGLRSLRCCKRRSVVSNLRGFGSKWAHSRLRIAVIHPSPIRASQYSSFSKLTPSSELALAAVAGLSLQGHAVTLYTSGYRQKDIPDYLWETSGDVKSCIPRLLRLALFPNGACSRRFTAELVSLVISVRVLISCIVAYLVNLLISLIPVLLHKSKLRHPTLLDVVITFEETSIPHLLLHSFAGEVVHFPNGKDYSSIVPLDSFLGQQLCNMSRTRMIVGTTDAESINWTMITSSVGLPSQVVTVYPPVISTTQSVLTPTASNRRPLEEVDSVYQDKVSGIIRSSRPYFMALAWYPDPSDLIIGIEAFALFVQNKISVPTESQSEPEEEGCTGSATLKTFPRLVIAGIDLDTNYLTILREINRLKLVENEDVVLIDSNCPPCLLSDLMSSCVGLIHTPGEVNHVRIPCAAMLASRPVITTVSFSKTEPVRHESTGILVKARSASVIAQAIENLFSLFVNRHQEWSRMGLRGRQRVLTEFSIEMFGSRLDDLLEGVKTIMGPPITLGPSGPLRARSVSGSARATSFHSGLNELIGATDSPRLVLNLIY
jgi:glycosyltransferase involved in cell wall biosynthesis